MLSVLKPCWRTIFSLLSAVGVDKDEAAKRRKRMYEDGGTSPEEIDVVMYNKYVDGTDGLLPTTSNPVSLVNVQFSYVIFMVKKLTSQEQYYF